MIKLERSFAVSAAPDEVWVYWHGIHRARPGRPIGTHHREGIRPHRRQPGPDRSGLPRGPEEAGSLVETDAEVTILGAAAQIGRPGLINEMATRMVSDFVTRVEARLAAPDATAAAAIAAPDVRGIRLFLASLFGAIGAWMKRRFGGDTGSA